MPLKTHHKILIGSFSTLVIIYLIINSIFVYAIFARIELLESSFNNRVTELQADTQSKLNDLSRTLLSKVEQSEKQTQDQLEKLKATASPDFSEIIDNSIKSVVTIRTDISQGTGFIIDSEGYIITNAHVLSGAKYAEAITSNQKIFSAELIGWNNDPDIAILKIKGIYESLSLANSDQVALGEKVIAIGNPLGLQFSVSEGIVSGVHRETSTNSGKYIQTDAALNPGNSGGPLINKQGKVIGINNFKVGGYEGLGFALESNDLRAAVNQILQEKNIELTI